jgi:hypothetical protein
MSWKDDWEELREMSWRERYRELQTRWRHFKLRLRGYRVDDCRDLRQALKKATRKTEVEDVPHHPV